MRAVLPSLKRIAKVAAKILLCLVFVHTALLLFWGWQLRATLAGIRSKGAPISISDIAPRHVPDKLNSAVYYGQANKIIYKTWSSNPALIRALDQFISAGTPQSRGMLAPSARLALKQMDGVFPLIDKAQSCPQCFVKRISDPDQPEWLWGGSSGFHRMPDISNCIIARALLESSDGRSDDAVADLIRDMRLGEAAAGKSTSVPGDAIQRARWVRVCLANARKISETHPLTEPQARRIYDELGKIDLDPLFVNGLKGDRAQICTCFDRARSHLTDYLYSTSWGIPTMRIAPFSRTVLTPSSMVAPKPGTLVRFSDSIISYLWRPFSYKDEMCYLQRIDQSLKLSRLPYRESLRMNASTPLYDRLTRLNSGRWLGAWRLRDMYKAEIGLGEAVMAMQAYKSRFGQYPRSLADLRSMPGWKLPNDPFSGKAFVYRPRGNGFTIYSIGPDLKDDGGRQQRASKRGDIVQIWKN